MNILGIANDETASACLCVDGVLVAAASEERFSRIKMDNAWPAQAIQFCLDRAALSLRDLDRVAYGWSAGFDADRHLLVHVDRIAQEARSNPEGVAILRERIAVEIDRDRSKREEFWQFVDGHGLRQRAIAIDHHESHGYSAYCCSPFEQALVVTCDGRGDFTSLTVGLFDADSANILYRASSTDSFGFFYGRITRLLGFTPHRHEGKVTGLAAHGDPEKLLPLMRQMIDVHDGRVVARSGALFRPFYSNFSEQLAGILAGHSREDIAAAAQRHLEQCLARLVGWWRDHTGARHVALAGGVFANVCVNQRIMELPGVDNIYVQPHMGDGGLCVGAAAGVLHGSGVPKLETASMYLGPEWSEDEILSAITAAPGATWERPDDLVAEVLASLEANQVVGWFQGGMEFGPRALCHRSILYHCRDRSANTWLNQRMSRTEFMPFAPVTAEELAPQCYQGWRSEHVASRYMTVTYHCTEAMKRSGPAAVHIDGTARPQVINRQDNALMHELLLRHHERTGDLALINTSFNRHEEPIVNRPSEAVTSLIEGVVDVLFIGPFMVRHGC